jgi:arylsulfatase
VTRWRRLLDFSTNAALALPLACGVARAAEGARLERPNVLVIFAADVGPWDLGAYHRGLGSGVTPQLDRLAEEGALFSDAYGQAGSAAARAAFLSGQVPVRTGVTGDLAPGPALAPEDPTLAELLRAEGYTTAHFGPSLLGERNDALPTARGFDVFRGPLALPGEAGAAARGVLDCRAAEPDPSAAPDPRFGPLGPQRCSDTGPLAAERLPELERESLRAAFAFLEAAVAARRPFFVWHNTARMAAPTRPPPELRGRSGQGPFADGLLELDQVAGALLAKLDALDVADATLVVFTSDRGPRAARWPDAGTTPFRDGEGPGLEAAVRVPLVARWPGRIQPGSVVSDLFAHEDWLPTLLSAAGRPDLIGRLREGVALGGRSARVHLDGHDQLPLLLGAGPGARRAYFHFAADGALAAVRAGDWKLWLAAPGAPLLLNLRLDPLERAPAAPGFTAWQEEQKGMLEPIAACTAEFLATFDAFPPRRPLPGFDAAALRERLAALAAPPDAAR